MARRDSRSVQRKDSALDSTQVNYTSVSPKISDMVGDSMPGLEGSSDSEEEILGLGEDDEVDEELEGFWGIGSDLPILWPMLL